MKNSFFGKHRHKKSGDEQAHDDVSALAPMEDLSIEPISDETLELEASEQVIFGGTGTEIASWYDSLIPTATAAIDTAAQYNHAIVRFPKGTKWRDLQNRKTPGWEEWKQLTPKKKGSFKPQAAIKQVKLSPTAIANLALQGAAVIVGQAYMTEINKQLEGLESGIAEIQLEMKIDREAKIEASFEMLREYAFLYGEISQNDEKCQAVLNGIEIIRKDVREAWSFQLKAMSSLDKRLASPHHMKDDEVKAAIREFMLREKDVLAVFQLYVTAEQTSMQYDNDFSTRRIGRERQRIQDKLDEYDDVRTRVQGSLGTRIKKVRGNLIAVPPVENDGYEAQNPLFDAAHAFGANASRFTPLVLRKEAEKQLAERKKRYEEAASADNPIGPVAEGQSVELEKMDFMFNHADAMVIGRDGIRFLKSSDKQDGNEDSITILD